jgi:hypothetical protein
MPLSSHIKPGPNPPLTLPRVIRAREMYAEGFTIARILAHCEMSLGTLYACLDGNPFAGQGEPMPRLPRRREVLGKRHRALKTDAASLTNRLLRTAERQVREIETRLSVREQPPVERERDVRMLMNLTRALRDLQALQKNPKPPKPFDDDDDEDRIPASVDALRQELSNRLAGMVASEKARRKCDD